MKENRKTFFLGNFMDWIHIQVSESNVLIQLPKCMCLVAFVTAMVSKKYAGRYDTGVTAGVQAG